MAKAHYLTDKDGNKFYPYAHAQATYMSDGTTVDNAISGRTTEDWVINNAKDGILDSYWFYKDDDYELSDDYE